MHIFLKWFEGGFPSRISTNSLP